MLTGFWWGSVREISLGRRRINGSIILKWNFSGLGRHEIE
jgi:hypothetical protein